MEYMVNFVLGQFQARIAHVGPEKLAEAEEIDFLGTALRVHAQQPDKLPIKDVFGATLANIGAGSDTTSVSLASIMYHLITSPESLRRVSHISAPVRSEEDGFRQKRSHVLESWD